MSVDTEASVGNPSVPAIGLTDRSLNDIVNALLRYQPIAMSEGDQTFVLENDDSRRILAYYERHRELWPKAKQVQSSEIEDVLSALEDEPPPKEEIELTGSADAKFWRLIRIEAHRFAGLHRHCGPKGEDPPDFVLEIDRDITLISGFNGAGKTALHNVIIWCLTGLALRSQHMPAEVHEPMEIYWERNDEEGDTQKSNLVLPPVVPIPSTADLELLDEQPKVDTWAKLTFQDKEADTICVVQRRLTVGRNGKISMGATGLDELGLSDLAIQAGTLMLGVAAHMRFDEKTTFADAIAQLTGLKPLEDLGRRTKRVVTRLRSRETRETKSRADEKLDEFKSRRQNIVDAWSAHPDLGNVFDLLAPDEENRENRSQTTISEARTHLERLKNGLESQAESVLGQAIRIDDTNAMLKQLAAASDALKTAAINSLPSIAIVKRIGAVTVENIADAQTLIEEMVNRANEVSQRLGNKQESARWQLYARVAAWHREHHSDSAIENCPVCGTDLDRVPRDALLNKGVKEALMLCADADADAAKGADEWVQAAVGELLTRLPESLRGFADTAPDTELLAIYRKAYVDELLSDSNFRGKLSPLRDNADIVWDFAVSQNPIAPAPDPTFSIWPKEFRDGNLSKRVSNIERVIRLVKIRDENAQSLQRIVKRYVGETSELGVDQAKISNTTDRIVEALPLRTQLEAIRLCIANAAPIVSLLRQLDELEITRKEFAALRVRLAKIDRAGNALECFACFEDLVYQQVTGLIADLNQGTQNWLQKIYRPHYHGGPGYSGFNVAEDKGIGLRAGLGGIQVPAHKIMNASQLRACVWAFAFSLWERVRVRMGGIDCLLLDDPQVYFDPQNAENFGAAIPEMPRHHMKPIVTSNDYRFLAGVRDKLSTTSDGYRSWRDFVMNPISRSRLTATVSVDLTEIHKQREIWQADVDNESKARSFVIAIRTYVENRLWDLLATDPRVMQTPTLADLIGALRYVRKNGEHPFEELPFENLLLHDAFKSDAPFYQIINKAHHQPQNITPTDATDVNEVFKQVDRLLRSCTASYERFMGRLSIEDRELLPISITHLPAPALLPQEPIPVVGEVGASVSKDVFASGEVTEEFGLNELGATALYGVRSSGLSPLVLQGQVVIVSLELEAQDGEAVVALHKNKVFLRRVLADQSDLSRVTLSCDQTGSDKVPPSLVLPRASTRLLPIIGVLYENDHFDGKEEAVEVPQCKLLDRDVVSARVLDDSAYPVIRNRDLVLIEKVPNLDINEINRLNKRIVVGLTGHGNETFAYLKRLNVHEAGSVCILENVGWDGNSIAVVTTERANSSELPSLEMLWRVHGTLRHSRN